MNANFIKFEGLLCHFFKDQRRDQHSLGLAQLQRVPKLTLSQRGPSEIFNRQCFAFIDVKGILIG